MKPRQFKAEIKKLADVLAEFGLTPEQIERIILAVFDMDNTNRAKP